MSAQNQPAYQEVAKLDPSQFLTLIELDGTNLGLSDVQRFFPATTSTYEPIEYNGYTYNPMPVSVTGSMRRAEGAQDRPRIQFGNLGAYMTALTRVYNDLVGAKITIRRVLKDTMGWTNPPEFPLESFEIFRKTRADKFVVEFELRSQLDLDGIKYPRRRVLSDYCSWTYRDGMTCPVSGARHLKSYADKDNNLLNGNTATEYVSTNTYSVGDVVWVETVDLVRSVFDLVEGKTTPLTYKSVYQAVKNVPAGKVPPNSQFWVLDACRRNVEACRIRNDIKAGDDWNNNPLPGSFFPGAGVLPQ